MSKENKDYLIDDFINDPLYKINRDGTIQTKLTVNGQGISKEWRDMGYQKADGYVRLRYKDDFIFAHRIIFRKFKGPIKEGYTIDHKDQNRSNNSVDNLVAVTQADNNKNKSKTYKKKKAGTMHRSNIIEKVMAKLAKSSIDVLEVSKLSKEGDNLSLLKYLRQWKLGDVSEFIENAKLESDIMENLYELDILKKQKYSFILNPNTPDKLVDKILKEEDKTFKKEVASSPKTLGRVLEKLAESSDWEVKLNVIHNSNTPKKVLEKFSKGSDELIAEEALKVLNSRN